MTAFLLVLSLALSTQGGLVVQTLFYLRHDYIATHLCVNRTKPHEKCHGKCFLKKRMADAERDDARQAPSSPSPVSFFVVAEADTLPPTPESPRVFPTLDLQVKANGHVRALDHPPRTA
ncbi:MAG TPA: hypothetical protein VFG50_03490 [Rhodothermales bacterium]|nr:hypothetical protein [Rhodothermales bacterium]